MRNHRLRADVVIMDPELRSRKSRPGGWIELNPCLELRQLADIPTSAQSFHQENACVQTAPQNIDVISLVGQSGCLRGDNLKIGIHSSCIPILKQPERFFSVCRRRSSAFPNHR